MSLRAGAAPGIATPPPRGIADGRTTYGPPPVPERRPRRRPGLPPPRQRRAPVMREEVGRVVVNRERAVQLRLAPPPAPHPDDAHPRPPRGLHVVRSVADHER